MRTLLLNYILLLTACASLPSDYTISHDIAASENNTIANWRKQQGIPRDALIAIDHNGAWQIVENPTRIREIPPNMSQYVNDFVECYLNMKGTYHAQPVTLQAPCNRDPELRRPFFEWW